MPGRAAAPVLGLVPLGLALLVLAPPGPALLVLAPLGLVLVLAPLGLLGRAPPAPQPR